VRAVAETFVKNVPVEFVPTKQPFWNWNRERHATEQAEQTSAAFLPP